MGMTACGRPLRSKPWLRDQALLARMRRLCAYMARFGLTSITPSLIRAAWSGVAWITLGLEG